MRLLLQYSRVWGGESARVVVRREVSGNEFVRSFVSDFSPFACPTLHTRVDGTCSTVASETCPELNACDVVG